MTEVLTRSEKKQRDIVAAAEKIFIEYGFAQASMNKIAEEAKVTKRTIYQKYENKQALFDAIMRDQVDSMFAQTNIPYDSMRGLKEQMLEMLALLWGTVSDERHIKLKRVVIAEYVRDPQFISSLLADILQRDEGLISWLQGAIDCDHIINGDKWLIFEFIVGLIERFSELPRIYNQQIAEGKKKDYILNEIADLIISNYGV